MGIASNSMLIISGVYLALGLIYLRFWWAERPRLAYLAFTISCFSYTIFAWFEYGMMTAASPEEFLSYAWWAFIIGGGGMVAFAWFAYLQLHGRKWLFVLYAAMRGLALVLHLVMANGINFREITSLGHRTVLGEALSYPIPVPNPWMLLPHVSHLLVVIFFLDASIRCWRRAERRTALIFGTGTILFGVATLIVPTSVLWGFAPIPLFASYSVLFIIAAMLYELNYDMHQAAMLTDKLEEREVRLTETLDQLELAASAGNVGMWVRSIDGEIIWASEKAGEIWGFPNGVRFTQAELIKKLHPDDHERVLACLQALSSGKEEYRIEFRIVGIDGNIRWVQSEGRIERVEGKQIVRGTLVDITRLKMTESRLTETLDQLQLSAAAADVGMWTRKMDEETIWVSEKASEIWGIPSGDQPVRENIFQNIHPDDRELFLTTVRDLEEGKSEFELEYRFMSQNDNVRWIHSRGKVESVNGSRIIRGAIVDVTKLRMAEARLTETLDQLQLSAAAANVGLWTRTIDGELIWASEKAAEIWGFLEGAKYTLEDFIQQLHPDDRPLLLNLVRELNAGKNEYQLEYRIVLKDGNVRWVHSSGKVEEVDGARIVRGAIVDITKLKMAEEAIHDLSGKLINEQEKERARLARELHDGLSQSIALLSIHLSNLSSEPKDLDNVKDRLDRLVSDVQILSVDIHRISHELHPARLTQLGLETALRGLCRDVSAAHPLEIDFEAQDVPRDLPEDISLCLYRVTQESLQNVVKHSGAVAARVSVMLKNGDVRLSVFDNGNGFDPSATKANESLGLISIEERVRAVNGMAKVNSELGAGTKVEVSIPFRRQM